MFHKGVFREVIADVRWKGTAASLILKRALKTMFSCQVWTNNWLCLDVSTCRLESQTSELPKQATELCKCMSGNEKQWVSWEIMDDALNTGPTLPNGVKYGVKI